MLEENGEDKMTRESSSEEVVECVGKKRTLLIYILCIKSITNRRDNLELKKEAEVEKAGNERL